MKLSEVMPSLRYLVAVAETNATPADLRHICRVKNFLRSKEKDTLSAACLNGTGCHKRGDNRDRGVSI